MAALAVHWVLEMCGSFSWACVRGRCKHRHHRVIGDALLTLVIAAATIKIVG